MAFREGTTKLLIGYGKATAKHLAVIQRYYKEVDGMDISKAEAFRRAVLILHNEIMKGEGTQR